jgi:nucleotide-binding universal stress UspA family protein
VSTFLVGVDGSDPAAAALSWASGLAGYPATDRLIIATVYVADPTDTRGWDQAHDRARERLEQWCQPARDHGVGYEAILLDGESGPALLAVATERDPDLIVVSRRGCGGFDALVAGSTADYLAHHTRRPLAIVPPEGADSPPAHLLIAVDGSSGSAAAATWAAQLATRLQARVTVAYASVPPEIFGRPPAGQRAAAEETLTDHWAAPLRQAGLEPDCKVVESRHPADALIELARDANADLIVAGTRAVWGLRRIRLGGVTMQLLHHSAVPVVVVPPRP